MKDWLIHKLGGYNEQELKNYLDNWLEMKLQDKLLKRKRTSRCIYESGYGTFQVRVQFIK